MAGNRRVKKQEHERITDANIRKVISLLESSPPITKKEACDVLGIAYNTTRLNKIIDEWKSDKEYRDKRKAQNRGKAATNAEIATIVESYLDGDAISEIAKRVFRSAAFVKALIEKVGVPFRPVGEDKHTVEYLPEACIAEEFTVGETAWSAMYHAPCEIREKLPESYNDKYSSNCYKVWVKERSVNDDTRFGSVTGGFTAYAPAYDLGKLEHLKKYGVKIDKL